MGRNGFTYMHYTVSTADLQGIYTLLFFSKFPLFRGLLIKSTAQTVWSKEFQVLSEMVRIGLFRVPGRGEKFFRLFRSQKIPNAEGSVPVIGDS